MKDLIIQLTIINALAKTIHYNYKGESYYGVHLLMDRVQKKTLGFIDDIKENYYLANEMPVPTFKETYYTAFERLGDTTTLSDLRDAVKAGFYLTNGLSRQPDMDVADNDLLGKIGSNLKNSLGLLNQLLK